MSAALSDMQQIGYEGYIVDYFTQLPNMAIDELEPYAYKLLAVYLNTIRHAEKGVCFKSNATIAKELGCSINRMKKARQELVDKGYIFVALGTESASRVTIQLKSMWERNHETESKKAEERRSQKSQGGCQNLTPPYQTVTGGVSEFDTNKEEYKKKNDKEKDSPLTPQGDSAAITDGKTVQAVNPELLAMQEAVKKHLKQYGKSNIQVAKALLGEYQGKDSSLNLSKKFSPALLEKFALWWDANFKDRDGKPLTRPKNLDSIKAHGETFLETFAKTQQAPKVLYAEPAILPSATDGVVTYTKKAAS